MTDRLLTRPQVADRFQITPRHLADLEKEHSIPILKAGRAVRYDTAAILQLEAALRCPSRSIAAARPAATITGIDMDPAKIAIAESVANPPNLRFVVGDATRGLPDGQFDVVVLSNVLEHIDARPEFLRAVVAAQAREAARKAREAIASTLATRVPSRVTVPLFERDWRLPMRRELGLPFVSDPDHRIEHTLAEFAAEIAAAGLVAAEQRLAWGEIWALCRPAPPGGQG